MQFENSVALVTGGGRGIGQAVALAFADAGADVAVADMDAAIAQETADLVEQSGRRSVAIGVDVREPDSVQAMVQATQKALGDLDIAVNNAGVISIKGIAELGVDDWDQVMAVNARGVFLCTKAEVAVMRRRRHGRIINMSSVVALTGNAGQANYTAAKAGLIGFTKTVAREVASRGITVNALAPGFIETRMVNELGEDLKKQIMERIPLARFGSTEDVAASVAFLASEDAAYITGQVLSVDGGLGL